MWLFIGIAAGLLVDFIGLVIVVFVLGAMPTEMLSKGERNMWGFIGIVAGIIVLAVIALGVWYLGAKYNGH